MRASGTRGPPEHALRWGTSSLVPVCWHIETFLQLMLHLEEALMSALRV